MEEVPAGEAVRVCNIKLNNTDMCWEVDGSNGRKKPPVS